MSSSNYAWYCSGYGGFNYYYFYYSLMCVPCAFLDLSEGED